MTHNLSDLRLLDEMRLAADRRLSANQLRGKYYLGEFPSMPRSMWRDAVAEEDTLQGYWDWVYHRLDGEA